MKDGLARTFHSLDGLVVLFLLFLDVHEVACCSLSMNLLFHLSSFEGLFVVTVPHK